MALAGRNASNWLSVLHSLVLQCCWEIDLSLDLLVTHLQLLCGISITCISPIKLFMRAYGHLATWSVQLLHHSHMCVPGNCWETTASSPSWSWWWGSLISYSLTAGCDAVSGRIKRATLQTSTLVPILSKTLPRHQLRVLLALRKLGKLLKSPLIPVRLHTFHPRLQLHWKLLILSSISSILSSTTSCITCSLQCMRVISHHHRTLLTSKLYLCLH